MLLAKRFQNRRGLDCVSGFRMIRRFDQPVRHTAHRGNDRNAAALLGCIHKNAGRARNARRVAHRRPAKLHHL